MSSTSSFQFRKIFWIGAILGGICLSSCGPSTPPLVTTLTLKRDGSRFSGTVIRREPNSITVTNASGDTRTFLWTELADIKYGAPASTPGTADGMQGAQKSPPGTPDGGGSASSGTASSPAPAGGVIQLAEGTEFPVRTNGFLDSCCVPPSAVSLGVVDENIKDHNGAVLIPEGASVTMTLVDEKKIDGRIEMTFELGSADFNGRHFVIASAKGGQEPGARVTFSGAKEGTQEAKMHGLNVHLDDRSYMGFKAATPVVFKLSQ